MAVPGQGTFARVEAAGLTRVQAERGRQTPAWETVSLLNAGAEPVQGIQLWGTGRTSLLAPISRRIKPADLYAPFSLLPGEVAALTGPATADQITGLLNWSAPRDLAMLKGSIQRSQRAEFTADGGIVLTPGREPAWVQFELGAPLIYSSVRVAWIAEPAPTEPYMMLSVDGNTWIRVPRRPDQPRVDWQHPLDLTDRVAGLRRFWIRLAYEVSPSLATRERGGSARPPESLRLRRLRIDREMQGPGRLRKWRTGLNEFDVSIPGPARPELEIRLSGGK
jgi:hypothetical protein